jgi:hypothetical protein
MLFMQLSIYNYPLILPRDQAHFSGRAHNILGKEAVKMVEANETVNAQIRSQSAMVEGNSTNQPVRMHLTPSLAPGY